MKKIIILLLAMLMVGCQAPQETKVDATSTEKEINTLHSGEVYTLKNHISYEIIQTALTDEIAPTNKNKTYQYLEPSQKDELFIDIIIKTTNLSHQEYELADLYSGEILLQEQSYPFSIAIESSSFHQISTTDTLKADEERYVHVYVQVPKEKLQEQHEAILKMTVCQQEDGQYSFSLEQTLKNAQQKSIGDVINTTNSQLTLLDCYQAKRVEPSDKGIFYSYYPPENDDEIFVILALDIENKSQKEIDPQEYVYCEYALQDQTIQSHIILESEDHRSILKDGEILVGQTRTVYLAMPILSSDSQKEGTIELFVEGDTYEIITKNHQ